MVRDNLNRMLSSLEVVAPFLETLDNGQKLFIMGMKKICTSLKLLGTSQLATTVILVGSI